MTAIQAYTPLAQAELAFRQKTIKFNRWKSSLTTRIKSTLPLSYPIEYTVGLIEEGGILLGIVAFGLPLSRESLFELAELLDSIFVDFAVEPDPLIGSLVFSDSVDPEMLSKELRTFREICDRLYPLIMHIRLKRTWSESLIRLALAPPEVFVRA
ncbi:MAG TPA: hypothetical protein VN701_00915 [Candidatus Paceibacterota bacterium]|nr:hypothetical protein [Candidatus Paceibacterota bacterium]